MALAPEQVSDREKLILSGLYLSKYDTQGVNRLGFDSFTEAFNVIGYALDAKPASVKNYRDEFDPLFPNPRYGWRKRPTRDYCKQVLQKYKDLDIDAFTGLVKSFITSDYTEGTLRLVDDSNSAFASRIMTGLAAEHYFEAVQPQIPELSGYTIQNTTRWGCGYDFRLTGKVEREFLAVEVKGLKECSGSLSLTPKEFDVASSLAERYLLFVVKNFRELPYHDMYWNPISSGLEFTRREQIVVSVSWSTTI